VRSPNDKEIAVAQGPKKVAAKKAEARKNDKTERRLKDALRDVANDEPSPAVKSGKAPKPGKDDDK
jgi:hypothetical protein